MNNIDNSIRVERGSVSICAFGAGAHVIASFTTYTEWEGRLLKKAIESLVSEQDGEWGVPEESDQKRSTS